MVKIKLQNVHKGYSKNEESKLQVLKNLSLEIDKQEIITILGPNGCGKTTLLNLIAGIIKPEKGNILFSNKQKLQIGYIWQDYRASLLPWYNVAENISYPLRIKGIPQQDRYKKVTEQLSELEIKLNINEHTYSLSGGQQQLVNILRCLIVEPDIILLDEPFSALDQSNQWKMVFLLEKIFIENKMPILFVSHDIDEAILLADKILLMNNSEGNIQSILYNDLPRPRNISMLSSSEHIGLRKQAIEYLLKKNNV
jgi:NitT/TauT family transport system ATP-binding protein